MSSPDEDFEVVNKASPPPKVNDMPVASPTGASPADAPAKAATAAPPSPQAAKPPASKTAATPEGGVPAAASGSSRSEPTMLDIATNVYGKVEPFVSWEDPVKTGAAFVATLSVFVLFFVLQVSLVATVTYVALAALVAAGAVVAIKPYYKVPVAFPPPAVEHGSFDAHGDIIADASRPVVVFAMARYTDFRGLLTWQSPYESARALALLYILACNQWLACPTTVFFAAMLLFSLPVAYSKYGATVDGVVATNVRPVANQVGTKAAAVTQALSAKHALLAFAIGGAIVVFMGVFSLSSWLLLSSWALVMAEVLPSLRPKTQ